MKIFSHRGWAAGKGENTLAAFRRSNGAGLSGVEFDVRLGPKGAIVVSHDHTKDEGVLTLEQALEYLQTTALELLIEFKEYSPAFFTRVVALLDRYGVTDRSTIFAFSGVSRHFPWEERRTVRLGIISQYPHHIKRDVKKYHPDMVLLGWVTKTERFLFKLVWSILSLAETTKKYPALRFVVGVAYNDSDVAWLAEKQSLYGVTRDNEQPLD